jgi:drug/metabolite transporter superfamily protein YnfA
MEHIYQNLADAVLLLHALFVVFVVTALLLIIAGGYRQWSWVRNWRFRMVHLASIALVVAQSWSGLLCPLTTLEMWFREKAGATIYVGGFIQYWIERFLYHDAPAWVFVMAYTAFGLLVVITWIRFPPLKAQTPVQPDN